MDEENDMPIKYDRKSLAVI